MKNLTRLQLEHVGFGMKKRRFLTSAGECFIVFCFDSDYFLSHP